MLVNMGAHKPSGVNEKVRRNLDTRKFMYAAELLKATKKYFIVLVIIVTAATFTVTRFNTVHAHAGMSHETIAAITEHTAAYRAGAQSQMAIAHDRSDARSESMTIELCLQNKQKLESVVNTASLLGIKKVTTLDAVYLGVQNYYTQRAIQVEGYEEAAAQVSAAQSAALIDSSVLGVLNRPLNCGSSAGLIDVIAFRSGAVAASNSLKVYEQSLLNLIELMQIAYTKSEISNQSGGGS